MRRSFALFMSPALCLAAAAYGQKPGDRPISAREMLIPHVFVATGRSADADLDRLRVALGKLPGITKVEARPEFSAVTVVIDGEGGSQSSLAAAAKTVGFVLRPAPVRSYAAKGPAGEDALDRLRTTIEGVHGVDKVEISAIPTGTALRVTGVMPGNAVVSAGETAGYQLRQLASYVVSGSSADADLSRLRGALGRVPGVEQVEIHGLTGGATLLIYGDARPAQLAAASKPAGYALWPLAAASGPRQFRIGGAGDVDQQKLREVVNGAGAKAEIRLDGDATRLVVGGDSMHQAAVVAAVTKAGFTLYSAEPVTLPTLVPETGRNTPPDVDSGGVEGQAALGGVAPDFTLVAQDGASRVSLHDLIGKKPVVLVFGSCT